MKEKGFTLIELLIVIAIVGIFLAISANLVLNNRGATEKRALELCNKYLKNNNMQAKRLTCAGDSDGDGYGTCNVVTAGDEKILLQCPTDYFDVNWFGASQCKEVLFNINMMQ